VLTAERMGGGKEKADYQPIWVRIIHLSRAERVSRTGSKKKYLYTAEKERGTYLGKGAAGGFALINRGGRRYGVRFSNPARRKNEISVEIISVE